MADSPEDDLAINGPELVSSATGNSPDEVMENTISVNPAESQDNRDDPQLECPICLQTCVHPVELPCKHIFCFLCIKGVAMQGPNGRCAICRSDIPHNVLTNPRLKDVSQLYRHVKTSSGFEWFYEARGGGWWQYDERSIQELEKSFEAGQPTCQLMIAGHLYDIDFSQMIQFRQNNRTLFRHIKRDTATAEKRGIAGIKLNHSRGNGGNIAITGDGNVNIGAGRRGRGGRNASNQTQPSSDNGSFNRPASQTQTDSQSQSQPSSRSSTGESGHVVVHSESESDHEVNQGGQPEDSDDGDFIVEEEDDMELGEEEELGESNSEDEDEEDLRDGARAPTRRSDRSNSSTNQTPPPGVVNGSTRNHSNSSPNSTNPNGRASRGAKNDRGNAGSRSILQNIGSGGVGAMLVGNGGRNITGGARSADAGSSSSSPSSPQFGGVRTISASNIRLSPSPFAASDVPYNNGLNINIGSSRTSSASVTTTTGITCLLIGPGVCITVDQGNSNRGDEVL